jgi:hypothetical protein
MGREPRSSRGAETGLSVINRRTLNSCYRVTSQCEARLTLLAWFSVTHWVSNHFLIWDSDTQRLPQGAAKCYWSSNERYKRFILEFFTRFGSDLLSHVLRRSTISATVLNDWVRNGARCFTRAMTTKPRKEFTISSVVQVSITVRGMCMTSLSSITRHALLLLDQIKPIEPLVPVNWTHCCAYISGLSTR